MSAQSRWRPIPRRHILVWVSRIPTFNQGSKDNVTVFVLKDDLLTAVVDEFGGLAGVVTM
ncbi:MAG: hypothetical protein CMQ05_08645 [Gammaproteobacteria bacterium]|nr:hypothetical protein [Gammaproteobacteria bacterium]